MGRLKSSQEHGPARSQGRQATDAGFCLVITLRAFAGGMLPCRFILCYWVERRSALLPGTSEGAKHEQTILH